MTLQELSEKIEAAVAAGASLDGPVGLRGVGFDAFESAAVEDGGFSVPVTLELIPNALLRDRLQ